MGAGGVKYLIDMGADQPDQFGTVIPEHVWRKALREFRGRVADLFDIPLGLLLQPSLHDKHLSEFPFMDNTNEILTIEYVSHPYPDRIRKLRSRLRVTLEAMKAKDAELDRLRKAVEVAGSEEMQFLKRDRGDAAAMNARLRKQVDDQAMEINRLKSVPETIEKQLATIAYELRVPIGCTDPLHIIARKTREEAEIGRRAMRSADATERVAAERGAQLIDAAQDIAKIKKAPVLAFDPCDEARRVLGAADTLIGDSNFATSPLATVEYRELHDAVHALREWGRRTPGLFIMPSRKFGPGPIAEDVLATGPTKEDCAAHGENETPSTVRDMRLKLRRVTDRANDEAKETAAAVLRAEKAEQALLDWQPLVNAAKTLCLRNAVKPEQLVEEMQTLQRNYLEADKRLKALERERADIVELLAPVVGDLAIARGLVGRVEAALIDRRQLSDAAALRREADKAALTRAGGSLVPLHVSDKVASILRVCRVHGCGKLATHKVTPSNAKIGGDVRYVCFEHLDGMMRSIVGCAVSTPLAMIEGPRATL